ncbi:hypothetical protein [Shewanella sp. TC10]|uniref:hypothetical protein n=1 Tax=Shewanella sp. TC10 TaxID=1419739 RepID=UPI00129D6622|nr:hypothetical protein [Shewanella sp. TC10]
MILFSFILVLLGVYVSKYSQGPMPVKLCIMAIMLIVSLFIMTPLIGMAAAIVALIASLLLAGIVVAMVVKRS